MMPLFTGMWETEWYRGGWHTYTLESDVIFKSIRTDFQQSVKLCPKLEKFYFSHKVFCWKSLWIVWWCAWTKIRVNTMKGFCPSLYTKGETNDLHLRVYGLIVSKQVHNIGAAGDWRWKAHKNITTTWVVIKQILFSLSLTALEIIKEWTMTTSDTPLHQVCYICFFCSLDMVFCLM